MGKMKKDLESLRGSQSREGLRKPMTRKPGVK